MWEIVYYCRDDVYCSRYGRYLLTVYHPQPTIYLLVNRRGTAKILISEYKLFREQTTRFCHKKDTFLITFCNSYIRFRHSSFFKEYYFTNIYETQVVSCRLPYASESHVVWLPEWEMFLQIHLYHLVFSWLFGTKRVPQCTFLWHIR